jgi:hypothetical protein
MHQHQHQHSGSGKEEGGGGEDEDSKKIRSMVAALKRDFPLSSSSAILKGLKFSSFVGEHCGLYLSPLDLKRLIDDDESAAGGNKMLTLFNGYSSALLMAALLESAMLTRAIQADDFTAVVCLICEHDIPVSVEHIHCLSDQSSAAVCKFVVNGFSRVEVR